MPYLLNEELIPDYSIIKATDFYNVNRNKDVNNDALWCQSANSSTNIGMWYYPNGTEVPLFDGDFTARSAPSPMFSTRDSVVRLH